ncbi:MAG TPA: class I SAM-dependent methyltransferase [Nitrospiria bacterium]|nr:class I SAM-dependent methyltransferase [Nitrospiria bacterium]
MSFIIDEEIEKYAFRATRPEPFLLEELSAKTHETMELPQMLTGRLEGRFLKLLVTLLRPRLILEVGTFTGYSALSMAEGLPDDGRIITCEVDPKARAMAQAAFDASPYGKKIEIRMGPALDTIRTVDETIDLSFIDADKTAYPDYYEEILSRTRPGGVILLDNMLWSGSVLEPDDDSSRTLARLNEAIARDDRVENVLLTVRDGIQFVRKK